MASRLKIYLRSTLRELVGRARSTNWSKAATRSSAAWACSSSLHGPTATPTWATAILPRATIMEARTPLHDHGCPNEPAVLNASHPARPVDSQPSGRLPIRPTVPASNLARTPCRRSVGWVERSEPHRGLRGFRLGLAAVDPPYRGCLSGRRRCPHPPTGLTRPASADSRRLAGAAIAAGQALIRGQFAAAGPLAAAARGGRLPHAAGAWARQASRGPDGKKVPVFQGFPPSPTEHKKHYRTLEVPGKTLRAGRFPGCPEPATHGPFSSRPWLPPPSPVGQAVPDRLAFQAQPDLRN